MLMSELKGIINIVKDHDYMLFVDNAISLYNDHRNGHIILDDKHDMIHYFANTGNTLQDLYIDDEGNKSIKSAEYMATKPEHVFYVSTKLDSDELKEVLKDLVAGGYITNADAKSILEDKTVIGQRSHEIPKEERKQILQVGSDGAIVTP